MREDQLQLGYAGNEVRYVVVGWLGDDPDASDQFATVSGLLQRVDDPERVNIDMLSYGNFVPAEEQGRQ